MLLYNALFKHLLGVFNRVKVKRIGGPLYNDNLVFLSLLSQPFPYNFGFIDRCIVLSENIIKQHNR